MKNFRWICLMICCFILIPNFTYGMESRPLNLQDLTRILVKDSLELQAIDLNQRITIVRYRQTLEDYKELKKKVENAAKSFEASKENLGNLASGVGAMPDDSPEKETMNHYMISAIYTYMFVEDHYKNLLQQEADMMRHLEAMSLIGRQAETRKRQALDKAKHDLQKDYLQLVILKEQKTLLEESLIYLDRQITIEKAKLELNRSTQVIVDGLESQRENRAYDILTIENTIEYYLQAMKTKLGIDVEEELNIVYEIPLGQLLFTNYNLAKLIDDFKNNNLELETLRNNADIQGEVNEKLRVIYEDMKTANSDAKAENRNDDLYQSALLLLEEDQLKITELEKSYELTIKNIYYQYNRNIQNIYLQRDRKQLAEEKLKQMEGLYKGGIISLQQLEMERQEIAQVLYEHNKAFIDFINIRSEIELIRRGIMPTS